MIHHQHHSVQELVTGTQTVAGDASCPGYPRPKHHGQHGAPHRGRHGDVAQLLLKDVKQHLASLAFKTAGILNVVSKLRVLIKIYNTFRTSPLKLLGL